MRIRLTAILALAALLAGCGAGQASTTISAAVTTTVADTTTTSASTTATAVPTTTSTLPSRELAWFRVLDEEGVLGGPGMEMATSIVAGGPGLVAVGADEAEGGPDAAVWVSANGYSWTRVPDNEGSLGGPGIQLINAVAAGGPGLVAVGQDDPEGSLATGWVDSDAAVWVSADGYTWTRIPRDEAIFGGPKGQRMMSVTAGGPGLVAIGSDYRDGSGWPDGAVWVSADGYAWSRVDDESVFGGPGGQEILSVTAGGPGVVAVGSGNSYANAAVWVSANGYSWTRVPHDEAIFGGPLAQEMVSVTVGGPGLVGIGGDSSDAAVWVSADGYTWTRVDDEATLGGPGNQSGIAVAVWQEGLVLVGKDESGDGGGVVFWVSADGYTWARIPSDQSAFGAAEDVEIGSVVGWGAGLVMFGGDLSSSDWDAAVWVSPPPGG
ncbi:MAG TPA: hypothetical protein VLS92_02370 [Acidimicrobiia bacterium]|nr:hypothetical protein [Acidimicrobiia bacterium]